MRQKIAAQKKEAAKKREAKNAAAAAAAAKLAASKPKAPVNRQQQQKRGGNKAATQEDQLREILMNMFAEAYKKYLEDIKGTNETPMPFAQFAELAYNQMMQMSQGEGMMNPDDMPVGGAEEEAPELEAAEEEVVEVSTEDAEKQ